MHYGSGGTYTGNRGFCAAAVHWQFRRCPFAARQHHSLKDVFAGAEWFPTATPAPQFGFLPLITGTLWVSLFAILIALPFGLAVAVYMSEVANHKIRNLMKPIIELLSGIPSVVYGFFGLIVIVPFCRKSLICLWGKAGWREVLCLPLWRSPLSLR